MNKFISKAWQQYENGKEHKRRIGLYENIRRNERFYRGEQWLGDSHDLPRPIFNIIRRIIDYLIGNVISSRVNICYTDESLPYIDRQSDADALRGALEVLGGNAAYRWEHEHMDSIIYDLMLDAAISGDGILYCSWDPKARTSPLLRGDIKTQTVDNTNVFVADVNRADIQPQEYIILSGRQSVLSLKNEARENGQSEGDIKKIVASSDKSAQAGDYAEYELLGDEEEKTDFIIKFWREDGYVCFEKSTRFCVINRRKTKLRLYPLAYFNWFRTKNSFHGTSPVTGLIPNQKFINRAYAMVMKHMTDTAFSKVIYDKSRIPEWSNEVGEAIAASGGGNMSDAVSVVGVGQLQSGYLELIERAMADTKELMGATETALGNTDPTNTSAILAMQEAARVPLVQVRESLRRCLEDLAAIWADMLCACYGEAGKIPVLVDGELSVKKADMRRLHDALIRTHVEIGTVQNYTLATTQSMLDRLLTDGFIGADDYLMLLPAGLSIDREELTRRVNEHKKEVGDGNE